MKYFIALFFILLASCSQNSDFKAGECTMGPDGFISKIISVDGQSYKVQNRVNETWATESTTPFTSLNKNKGFVVISCP